MGVLDWLLLAAVLGLAVLALWRWRRSKGGCAGCQGCAMADTCRNAKRKKK
ncbi:MAG: hypothetical protein ACLRP7_07685 [Christensenellales bacterium]